MRSLARRPWTASGPSGADVEHLPVSVPTGPNSLLEPYPACIAAGGDASHLGLIRSPVRGTEEGVPGSGEERDIGGIPRTLPRAAAFR